MRLYLLGFMGSGKSHVGKKLSARLNIPFIDLDDYIVRQEQKSINQIFQEKGEAGFRQIEKQCLINTGKMPNVIIGCGGGTPCFFNNMEWMNENGATYYLNYPVEILFHRLKTRKSRRPLIKDMDDSTLFSFINQKLNERSKYYLKAQYQFTPDKNGKEAVDVIEAWVLNSQK